MDIDQTTQVQSESLISTATTIASSLSSSLSNLSSASKTIPSNKDFHFYYNFDEFKRPIQQMAATSRSLLESIGSNKKLNFPNDHDTDDDTYDWLVNVNDEILEHFDASIDEFKSIRKKQEEKGGVLGMEDENNESEFQLVYGKKKKVSVNLGGGSLSGGGSVSASGVKVADLKAKGVKAKVPFHIPTIKKPQEQYNILVNNSNQPFEHVWLMRSEDGLRFIHPLEKLSVLDFVDRSPAEPVSPPPVESTPFKLVEEVKDLKQLAAKLKAVNEFAVDLEHNQYRSFQGLTCLMQISTRSEDFIIDTLKLRIHVGPYLREVFKDPTKRKVMHGADRDIIWLQRDFGIYVCNMFDTGQASRVLQLERYSLEFLLLHFCGVTANKEYQNADWRLRPLTDEMLRYAREDTHYLLYVYDLMRVLLLSKPSEIENCDSSLVEVYRRSYDVCMQLYEKELLTESSYLHIYGLQNAGFNAQQLAIVAGLCEWRDVIARAEDESTGFILPNKTLLEIARQMPVTPQKLRRALKSKHPYIERNLGSVINVIRHAMQNAAEFEAAAQSLKEGRVETASKNVEVHDDMDANMETADAENENTCEGNEMDDSGNALQTTSPELEKDPLKVALASDGQGHTAKYGENGVGLSSSISELPRECLVNSLKKPDATPSVGINPSATVAGATVQVSKKTSSAFGALLGGSAGKKRFDIIKKDKEEIELDKIRTSINLPFHSFSGGNEKAKPVVEEPSPVTKAPRPEETFAIPAIGSSVEEIIMLDHSSDVAIGEENADSETKDAHRDVKSAGSESGTDDEGEPASLSDLSTSFQKCFQSNMQSRTNDNIDNSQDPTGLLQLKPFDYAAARKQVRFGEDPSKESQAAGGDKDQSSHDRKKTSVVTEVEGSREFAQGRRRQAFPATGNRSATFR